MSDSYPRMSADEAAELIKHEQTVAFSGFTTAGYSKLVPLAIAAKAKRLHGQGKPFGIGVITGASTGKSLDGALAQAECVLFRTPFQSNPDLRKGINEGRVRFFDMHLSMLPQAVRYGFLGPVHCAVVEACDVNASGEITLTSSVGASPTFCHVADKIIVELNHFHPAALRGFHDIYEPANPPDRQPIGIVHTTDRIGSPTIKVDPKKIVAVVENDSADEAGTFSPVGQTTARIGQHVAEFLAAELRMGRIPGAFLPIQSGVGDTANAVLNALGEHAGIPAFEMYTEVIQDSVVTMMRKGKVRFASTCGLTVSNEVLRSMYDDLEFFRSGILMRPQEISNSPEVIRRLGVISINTPIEADVAGNVNSTHVLGRDIMNGIGGSADFARNAFLTIFTCPSTAKNGKISTIVPFVSHLDSSEHSVQVIVTDQGVADLRGKSPLQRARTIIENCAHPDYRRLLTDYISLAGNSHSPQTLRAAFGMHLAYQKSGDMRDVKWGEYK